MTIKILAKAPLRAAGALIVAADTLSVLTVLRSAKVADGSCWCGVGGKIEKGETPLIAARREIAEEIGYADEMRLLPAFEYKSEDLVFYNFIGLVPKQFIAKLNWESDGYAWTPVEQIPKPYHYGLVSLLKNARTQKLLLSIQSKNTNRDAA